MLNLMEIAPPSRFNGPNWQVGKRIRGRAAEMVENVDIPYGQAACSG